MNPAIVENLTRMIAILREGLGDHDADEILREDMIDGETDADVILSCIARAFNVAKADHEGAKAALEAITNRYEARAASAQYRMEAHRRMMFSVMEAMSVKSKKLPVATISVSPGRVSLQLADDFSPPQGYYRTKIEPDKPAIKSALETGNVMPGAELVTGNPIVTVR